jgi:hypothetical protein
MEHRHLEQANRHIAEGRERIAARRTRIALREHGGHDAALARDLLRHLETALEHMLEHRGLILKEHYHLQQKYSRDHMPYRGNSRDAARWKLATVILEFAVGCESKTCSS